MEFLCPSKELWIDIVIVLPGFFLAVVVPYQQVTLKAVICFFFYYVVIILALKDLFDIRNLSPVFLIPETVPGEV